MARHTRVLAPAGSGAHRWRMEVLTGTSGFSYAAWKGAFYPRDLPAARMLAWYAARLRAVEANVTFHRVPRAGMLTRWRAQVGPAFVFALKAPQRVTHVKRLRDCAAPLGAFHRAAAELGPALGPVLYQLPPTLPCDLPLLEDFLAALPAGQRAAFEFRHPSWWSDAVLAALAKVGAALCIAETDEAGTTPAVPTARFGYLRLRRASYAPRDLTAWADRILASPWSQAFVFFKHEDEARGPSFALALAALLDGTAPGVAARPSPAT